MKNDRITTTKREMKTDRITLNIDIPSKIQAMFYLETMAKEYPTNLLSLQVRLELQRFCFSFLDLCIFVARRL